METKDAQFFISRYKGMARQYRLACKTAGIFKKSFNASEIVENLN